MLNLLKLEKERKPALEVPCMLVVSSCETKWGENGHAL
jgi:hypothetical protein